MIEEFSTTDIPDGEGLRPPPLSGRDSAGDDFEDSDEDFEDVDGQPGVRRSVLRPVVGVLAWLLVLGVIAGCSYVLIQSFGDGPAVATATPQAPEPRPPSIEELMSAVNVERAFTQPPRRVRPLEEEEEEERPADGAAPTTGPSAVPSPPAPIPGVSLDECDWEEVPTDPALADEQVAAALRLQGYVFEGDKRCAISGRMFREGDQVGRFRVERIDSHGVLIRSDRFAGLLPLGQQGATPVRQRKD